MKLTVPHFPQEKPNSCWHAAARMFGLDCAGRTSVTRGVDFRRDGLRYQVKANRPSGKPGSPVTPVTLVARARNYDWDRLIWLLYDREFHILEAWEWTVDDYRTALGAVGRLSPSLMRGGRGLQVR